MSIFPSSLSLRLKFSIVSGICVLGLAAAAIFLTMRFEVADMEARFKTASENELHSLHALDLSAMERRREDKDRLAVAVFERWFDRRNEQYPGKLWSVWGPKELAAAASGATDQGFLHQPRDDIDREVIDGKKPMGRFVGETYRYSIPIILGVTQGTDQHTCINCHRATFDEQKGDLIAVFSSSLNTANEMAALHRRLWIIALSSLVVAVMVTSGVYWLFTGVIHRPLTGITKAMAALSGGRLDIGIPAVERKDEIGQMASSLKVFQNALTEAETLRALQIEEREKAERAKIAALRKMAMTVEEESRSAVDRIATLTTRMAESAAQMAQTATTVGSDSQNVAAAAHQALANAQSVTSSAGQLSASINEIATQVVAATQVSNTAADLSGLAKSTIGDLSVSIEGIGRIASLISGIAGQTNLLALNATIEAARSGDAGKGFAVVANEVKELASQTAKATEEIGSLISAIQTKSREAVSSVDEIGNAVGKVQGVSASIAVAIEQQRAATEEIVRNVQQTSDAAHEVALRIARVSDDAKRTGDVAVDVGGTSSTVAESIDVLRKTLVATVRTSTREVNRRQHPRYRIDSAATILFAGREYPVSIDNISQGGLMAHGPLDDIASGSRVRLDIPGVHHPFAVDVLFIDKDQLHGRFALNPPDTEQWQTDLAELTKGLVPLSEVA